MLNRYERCPNCMNVISDEESICGACGFDFMHYEEKSTCLRPFTVLQNKYMIGRVIGVGGFGITYIGWDLNLQTYIAIKEYFPDSIASRDTGTSPDATQVVPNDSKVDVYNKGLKRYVEEAQNVSKFYNLQGIVSVKDFFYENGTAYIVMEYINGINLKEFLNNSGGRLDENTVLALMKPVLESLFQIHNAGLIHRDISPDNIMVNGDGKIKLIDFGSARGESAETDKTYTVILKHGYAPSEQYYAKGNQGPWTDIYSICATMYKMLTGKVPPNSIERMENDTYVPPSAWGISVSQRTEAVMAKGLAVKASDRYQNIGDMLGDLYGERTQSLNYAGMAVNGSAAYNSPVSTQSMHLNIEPLADYDTGIKKKNNRIIIGSCIAGVVLIAVIAEILFGGGKDQNKPVNSTEDSTTESTTEGGTTEAATEAPPVSPVQSPAYIWPTALSDNWKDYTANISGTIYQFPIPYTEFAKKGWRADVVPTFVASGDTETIEFYDDKLQIDVVVANYSVKEMPLESCLVIGFELDRYAEISKNAVLEIAGGVKLYETTLDEAKKILGAPDYVFTSEAQEYDEIAYYNSDRSKGLDLRFDTKTGKLSNVGMINIEIPEGATASTDDIDKEPPEINSHYVPPAGPSKSRDDNIITVDGTNIKLPCPISVLVEAGWSIDDDTDEYISAGTYDNSINASLQKDGSKIDVKIENITNNSILPQNGLITSVTVDASYCAIPVVFPGGISVDEDAAKITQTYSDLEAYAEEEYGSFQSYYIGIYPKGDYNTAINIYATADTDTKKITRYTYSESDFKLD